MRVPARLVALAGLAANAACSVAGPGQSPELTRRALASAVERRCDGGPPLTRLVGQQDEGRSGDYTLWYSGTAEPDVATYALVQRGSPCVLVLHNREVVSELTGDLLDPYLYNLQATPQLYDLSSRTPGFIQRLNSGPLQARLIQDLLDGCATRGGQAPECRAEAERFLAARTVSLDIDPPDPAVEVQSLDVVDGQPFWQGEPVLVERATP